MHSQALATISMRRLRTIIILTITLLTREITFGQVLIDKFNRQWVNTSLFDSTKIKRNLSPWINEFYGMAILKITRDTLVHFSCMDEGQIENISITDETHFTTSEISFKPKFEHIKNSDLIKITTKENFLAVVFKAGTTYFLRGS